MCVLYCLSISNSTEQYEGERKSGRKCIKRERSRRGVKTNTTVRNMQKKEMKTNRKRKSMTERRSVCVSERDRERDYKVHVYILMR